MDALENGGVDGSDGATSWLYALFAANLYRFRPEIDARDYPQIYQRLISSKYRAADDQMATVLPVQEDVLAELQTYVRQIKDAPGIVATFHTGSYRLLSRVMYTQGLNVAVLMSREILAEQGEYLFAQHQQMNDVGRLQLIDADAGNSLLKILAAIRDGYHIVVYMDGNHGAGTAKDGSDMEEVPFFQSDLRVRKGLAVLSYKRQIPIYPILSALDEADEICYQGYPAILPTSGEFLEDYSARVFRGLYTHLQEVIRHQVAMWEGWLYVHTMPVDQSKKRTQTYWPCRVGTRYYVMISPQYTCQEIGKWSFWCLYKWKRFTGQLKN